MSVRKLAIFVSFLTISKFHFHFILFMELISLLLFWQRWWEREGLGFLPPLEGLLVRLKQFLIKALACTGSDFISTAVFDYLNVNDNCIC